MLALSATVAVLLGATLVLLIVAVTGQRDAGRIAFRSQQALTLMSRLETSLFAIENGLRDYVDRYPDRPVEKVTQQLRAYPAQVGALAAKVSDDRGQRARVELIGAKITRYVTSASSLIELVEEDADTAQNLLFYTDNRDLVLDLGKDLRDLAGRERTLVRRRENDAEARSALAIAIGLGGLALVFVVVAGGTLYLRRALVRPVVSVAKATGQLAAGDLSTRVPANREDEIGELARGFNSMADSLQRSQAELERSNRELEQFASVTSHDLQAPLSTISMYAELLERRHGSDLDGGTSLIDGIRGATQQARTLIRDLLEYSRAGRGRLRVEAVAIEAVVEHALEAVAGDIQEAGARVAVGPLPVVHAERTNLGRVFQNLVANAVKFRGERPPEVAIGAEREGPAWRFWVSDNGIGMDPQHAERIFEPFQRLHGEEDYAGTGIGLAVCARIVEQHGGRIWVTTNPGEGSVFSFTLPAREA